MEMISSVTGLRMKCSFQNSPTGGVDVLTYQLLVALVDGKVAEGGGHGTDHPVNLQYVL